MTVTQRVRESENKTARKERERDIKNKIIKNNKKYRERARERAKPMRGSDGMIEAGWRQNERDR
jgi:hypothetical protein